MNGRATNLLLITACLLLCNLPRASAQTAPSQGAYDASAASHTSFPYQGLLHNTSGPVTAACDFKFSLYDGVTAGVKLGNDLFRTGVTLTNGYFAVQLDFGDVFGGAATWLEVAARCPTNQGAYVSLLPRQEIGWTPRATVAQRALTIDSSPGDFTANGALRSVRNDPQVGLAGALELVNGNNGNRWQLGVGRADDVLVLGLIPVGQSWRHAASFTADGDLILVHDFYLNGVVSSNLVVNGLLRSARGLPEDTSAGLLELENTLTNNKWHITTNRDTDNLEMWFAENGSTWSHAATLERDGDFTVNNRMHIVGDSLNFMNAQAGILWQDGGAAIGHALNVGEYSADAQPGDLVMRADDGRRILLGRASAQANYPAALTVAASGQVSIPNLQTGGIVEANLQTPSELAEDRIARFSQGDVLCWGVMTESLERCRKPASLLVVAIANEQGKPLVAGVEPVRVCGAVHPGDLLVASAEPGCAAAWMSPDDGQPPPGVVIAKALGTQVDGEGLVKALILAR